MRLFDLVLVLILAMFGCSTPQRAAKVSDTKLRQRASIPRPELRLVDVSGPSRMTTLATYKVGRDISMFYKLDLEQENRYANAIAMLLRQQEEKFRACYLARLDQSPQLRGHIAFSFVVTKAVGSMDHIKRVGGSLDDPRLNACLSRELAKVALNPPRNLRGKLLYSFDVIETVAKNAPLNR